VVLLGDAAHAMLPHQGQGANQTIEDAAVLAAELDGATGIPAGIPAALGRYTARRRVRTRQVQLVSWAASAALHLPDGPAAQRRDAGLPGTPRDLAWIHGYDVLAPATGRGARCSAAAGSPNTKPARSPAAAARPSRTATR
jgi:2-polyprenyl-6-methoxyphenol hydroxylase-like FAD-dependent oxidoreductase